MYPGCFIPPVNTFFSFSFALQEQIFGKGAGVRMLSQPNRPHLPKLNHKPAFNILIILGESARAMSSQAHGYSKPTNPRLTAFLNKNEGVAFPRFYSVCTRTMLAFPSFLTGVSPSQSMGLLHHQPTLFNFAKAAGANTFLISAQSNDWGNFRQFINDGSIDYLYDRETSGAQPRDASSIPDSLLPAILGSHLRTMNEPFVGMIHFFLTHYPYYSDPEDQLFEKTASSEYEASTHALDRQIGRVLDTLNKLGYLDNTIILFSSDHGEAMNEHGYWGHLHTFYNEEASVPAWIYVPSKLRTVNSDINSRYKSVLQNIQTNLCNLDIVPTVMELLGIWDNPQFANCQISLQGRPITRPIDFNRIIFMQNYNVVEKNTMFVGMGLLFGNQKYLLHTKNNALVEEIYNIAIDPYEKVNLIDKVDPFFFHQQLLKYPASRALLQAFYAQNKK